MIEGAAVSVSLLCLVHCLALPLLLLLLPVIVSGFVASELFHQTLLLLVAPSAAAAFWLGYRHHRTPLPALFGVAGVTCLTVAVIPGVAEGVATALTVAGSVTLVLGHMLNWQRRARTRCG